MTDTPASAIPGHHTTGRFRNNYPTGWGRASFWRWQYERWVNGVAQPPPGGWHFPSDQPDGAFLRGNRQQATLTWLGHATFLLQIAGLNILTDPHLSARASPFRSVGPRRWMPAPLACHELPHIDLVLLSHNHYDHLDAWTVEQLKQQPGGEPHFLVPLRLASWFTRRGIRNVSELHWWQTLEHVGVRLTFTPVQHWSARTPWDRDRSLWGGWRLDHPELSFFFAGDTGYSADFAEIHARLGPVDLAALPIGAYEPRWFMQVMHVNPDEAVRIHLDLHARQSVAMHWGTFVLTDEPLDEPPHRLRRALGEQSLTERDFWLMRHGETRLLTTSLTTARHAPAPAVQ